MPLIAIIARVLYVIFPWFTSIMAGALTWSHLAIAGMVISVAVIFLDKILLIVGYIGAQLLSVVVRVGISFLLYIVGKMPDMPADAPSVAWSTLISAWGFAERYMPMGTFMTYAGIVFAAYSLSLGYKLAKFLRGGG